MSLNQASSLERHHPSRACDEEVPSALTLESQLKLCFSILHRAVHPHIAAAMVAYEGLPEAPVLMQGVK